MTEDSWQARRQRRPVYAARPSKVSGTSVRSWSVLERVDIAFAVIATVGVVWFTWIVLRSSFEASPVRLAHLLLFWLVLTYLALPRIHQVLTGFYVPDYFIGRTRNGDGLLGDPVNIALLGSEGQIRAAMNAAGWETADPVTPRNAWRTIVATLGRRSYPTAPVSNLYLFGREQAFTFQKEAEGNPAQRHHVRFWRTPSGWLLPGGHRVDWLAAGTYDRAVGLSAFTWQITHKIDANIDLERDYIVDDVRWACPEVSVEVITDFSTSYHSRNGGGDTIVTDGDLPIVDLRRLAEVPQATKVVPIRPRRLPHHPVGDSLHEIGTELSESASDMVGRSRPPSLVFGVLVVVISTVLTYVMSLGLHLDRARQAVATVSPDPTSRSVDILTWVVGALVAMVALGSAAATWLGHPRGRVVLESSLLATIIVTGVPLSTTSSRDLQSLGSMSWAVLALLAVTSRRSRAWTEDVKAARRERRAASQT